MYKRPSQCGCQKWKKRAVSYHMLRVDVSLPKWRLIGELFAGISISNNPKSSHIVQRRGVANANPAVGNMGQRTHGRATQVWLKCKRWLGKNRVPAVPHTTRAQKQVGGQGMAWHGADRPWGMHEVAAIGHR